MLVSVLSVSLSVSCWGSVQYCRLWFVWVAGELAQWGVAQMTTDEHLRALHKELGVCAASLYPGTWVEETGDPWGLLSGRAVGLVRYCGFRVTEEDTQCQPLTSLSIWSLVCVPHADWTVLCDVLQALPSCGSLQLPQLQSDVRPYMTIPVWCWLWVRIK